MNVGLSCLLLSLSMFNYHLITEIKCQHLLNKVKPASSLALILCLCSIETCVHVCKWVACFPSAGDGCCANFELSLPPQHVWALLSTNRLWHMLLIALQVATVAKLSFSSRALPHLHWLDVCLVDAIEKRCLSELLLEDWYNMLLPLWTAGHGSSLSQTWWLSVLKVF